VEMQLVNLAWRFLVPSGFGFVSLSFGKCSLGVVVSKHPTDSRLERGREDGSEYH
jgi:hypothetical protein